MGGTFSLDSYVSRCGELETQCAKGVQLIMTLQQRLRKPSAALPAGAPPAAAPGAPLTPAAPASTVASLAGGVGGVGGEGGNARGEGGVPGTGGKGGGVGGKGGLHQLLAALTKQKQEAASYGQVV